MSLNQFYRIVRYFTQFYLVLPSFIGLGQIGLGFTGFYWVLLGFTGFYWVLPSLYPPLVIGRAWTIGLDHASHRFLLSICFGCLPWFSFSIWLWFCAESKANGNEDNGLLISSVPIEFEALRNGDNERTPLFFPKRTKKNDTKQKSSFRFFFYFPFCRPFFFFVSIVSAHQGGALFQCLEFDSTVALPVFFLLLLFLFLFRFFWFVSEKRKRSLTNGGGVLWQLRLLIGPFFYGTSDDNHWLFLCLFFRFQFSFPPFSPTHTHTQTHRWSLFTI